MKKWFSFLFFCFFFFQHEEYTNFRHFIESLGRYKAKILEGLSLHALHFASPSAPTQHSSRTLGTLAPKLPHLPLPTNHSVLCTCSLVDIRGSHVSNAYSLGCQHPSPFSTARLLLPLVTSLGPLAGSTA